MTLETVRNDHTLTILSRYHVKVITNFRIVTRSIKQIVFFFFESEMIHAKRNTTFHIVASDDVVVTRVRIAKSLLARGNGHGITLRSDGDKRNARYHNN